jgi:hypothetical protein
MVASAGVVASEPANSELTCLASIAFGRPYR